MPKKRDDRQISMEPLFFAVAPAPETRESGLCISAAVRETLSDILAEAKARTEGALDRFAVAAAMSRASGREISKHMLDRYTAPSAEEWRFPLEALPALVKATGDYRLLELVAEACGCRILRGEEAWIAEVSALKLLEKHVAARVKAFERAVPNDVLQRLVSGAMGKIGGGR